MSNSLASRLDGVNCKPLKCPPRTGETFLQLTEASAQLIARALDRAGLTVKAAASDMGISESLLARQLKGMEHLSWQRLNLLPDRFFYELLFLIAEARGLAQEDRTLRMRRPA